MKTRSPGSEPSHSLPPPPAPPAADANPWSLSPPSPDTRTVSSRPQAPGRPPLPRPSPEQVARRPRRSPWAPLIILLVIGAIGLQVVIRAIWAGDIEAAVVALAIVAMVAFIAVRRLRRKH